jgi:hypothetical protein
VILHPSHSAESKNLRTGVQKGSNMSAGIRSLIK